MVNFFFGFFASQRSGSTMHSPQHCLPGAGWTPTEHRYIQLSGPHGPQTVNLYVIAKGLGPAGGALLVPGPRPHRGQ